MTLAEERAFYRSEQSGEIQTVIEIAKHLCKSVDGDDYKMYLQPASNIALSLTLNKLNRTLSSVPLNRAKDGSK